MKEKEPFIPWFSKMKDIARDSDWDGNSVNQKQAESYWERGLSPDEAAFCWLSEPQWIDEDEAEAEQKLFNKPDDKGPGAA